MAKILIKSDLNRIVRKLAASIEKRQARTLDYAANLPDTVSIRAKRTVAARVAMYAQVSAQMARLTTIAATPTSLTQAMLAEAWDAIIDIAMEMKWSLDGDNKTPSLFTRTYEIIDELRTKYSVDSTDPEAYAA